MLVNITSDDKDNPYLIFESLNNKGQELTQADLVRNYIFMQLPPDRQEDLYREEWLPLQEQFKNNACQKGYVEQLTNAFWFHLRKDGKSINQKEVYKKIKEQFDKSEIGVQHELKSLIKSAKYYQRFNFKNQENIPKLNCYFQRFLRLDFTTCQIFLLNVYQEFEQKKLSLEDFEKILQYLESYFVRRWLAGVPTRSLGNVFNKLYNQVKANNPHDLVSGLREVLLSFTGNQVWSDDDSFRHGIINQAVYTKTSNDRVKLFLERIEESLSGKELVNFQNLSIEHIMPQNLTEDWQIMLEENYDSIHKKWLHTLGNLTLTGYNSELSNRSFEEKLSQIGNFSNITLNKYYLQKQVEIWNEEAIKNRAEYLANIAVKVWSR